MIIIYQKLQKSAQIMTNTSNSKTNKMQSHIDTESRSISKQAYLLSNTAYSPKSAYDPKK